MVVYQQYLHSYKTREMLAKTKFTFAGDFEDFLEGDKNHSCFQNLPESVSVKL